MLKEKTICSQCTLTVLKTGESITVKAPTVTYECTQDNTDNGIQETETITVVCPAYRQEDELFNPYTRYTAVLNSQHVVGTTRYPLLKSVSTSGQSATLTFTCVHPAI